jgi:predicted DNA-binding protein
MKTLAIRLEEETHAQLAALSALKGTSLVEEIREAIEGHVEREGAEGKLAERAQAALAEIDREAETRRAAIQALMGSGSATGHREASRGRLGRKAEPEGGAS